MSLNSKEHKFAFKEDLNSTYYLNRKGWFVNLFYVEKWNSKMNTAYLKMILIGKIFTSFYIVYRKMVSNVEL